MTLNASGAAVAVLAGSVALAQAPPVATSQVDQPTSHQFNGQLGPRRAARDSPAGARATLIARRHER